METVFGELNIGSVLLTGGNTTLFIWGFQNIWLYFHSSCNQGLNSLAFEREWAMLESKRKNLEACLTWERSRTAYLNKLCFCNEFCGCLEILCILCGERVIYNLWWSHTHTAFKHWSLLLPGLQWYEVVCTCFYPAEYRTCCSVALKESSMLTTHLQLIAS